MVAEIIPNTNEFSFLINKNGSYMKTRFQEDFDEVLSWGEVLFSGVIKNSGYLHFKIGKTWHKKQITQLPISKSSDITCWYDVNELDMNGSQIYKIKFGGTKISQTYEKL